MKTFLIKILEKEEVVDQKIRSLPEVWTSKSSLILSFGGESRAVTF